MYNPLQQPGTQRAQIDLCPVGETTRLYPYGRRNTGPYTMVRRLREDTTVGDWDGKELVVYDADHGRNNPPARVVAARLLDS